MTASIVLFRRDLRLSDNPALIAAAAAKNPVIPIYLHEDTDASGWPMGDASKAWLHHSLRSLNRSLDSHLAIVTSIEDVAAIAKKEKASVYWNRRHDPQAIENERRLAALLDKDISHQSFQAALLWEPDSVMKKDGTPYKVFGPFYRKGCLGQGEPRSPHRKPSKLTFKKIKSTNIESLGLLPDDVRWDKKVIAHWQIGEDAAAKALRDFLKTGFNHYRDSRNFPARKVLSGLSPYTHFGEISPFQIWHAARHAGQLHHQEADAEKFLSEVAWREFSYYLMHHFPALPNKPWNGKFSRMTWSKSNVALRAWQKGLTGYPMVDAGMRELWETGYMHNRVRMITASFLIKHLGIDWVTGEKWFWDCLVDADLAVNAFNWQWVAGCGADASPFFRVFNPVLQGEKFDKKGAYVAKWVPELAKLPEKYIHAPWTMPKDLLAKAGLILGETYPHPIVDHAEARASALHKFKALKGVSS